MSTSVVASPSSPLAPAASSNDEAVLGVEVTAAGPTAGAALLMRSILGADAWNLPTSTRSASNSLDGVSGTPGTPGSARSRRQSGASQRSMSRANAEGEHLEPQPKNWEELNDLIKELHRNQLFFMYLFSSARESFQNGPQQQAESVQKTLDDLASSLDTCYTSRRRMLDIQRRVTAIKTKVEGWRNAQIAQQQQQQQQGGATAAATSSSSATPVATAE